MRKHREVWLKILFFSATFLIWFLVIRRGSPQPKVLYRDVAKLNWIGPWIWQSSLLIGSNCGRDCSSVAASPYCFLLWHQQSDRICQWTFGTHCEGMHSQVASKFCLVVAGSSFYPLTRLELQDWRLPVSPQLVGWKRTGEKIVIQFWTLCTETSRFSNSGLQLLKL